MMNFLIFNFIADAKVVALLLVIKNNHLFILCLFHFCFVKFIYLTILILLNRFLLIAWFQNSKKIFLLIYHSNAISTNSNFFHIYSLNFTWIHHQNYYDSIIQFNHQNLFIFDNLLIIMTMFYHWYSKFI